MSGPAKAGLWLGASVVLLAAVFIALRGHVPRPAWLGGPAAAHGRAANPTEEHLGSPFKDDPIGRPMNIVLSDPPRCEGASAAFRTWFDREIPARLAQGDTRGLLRELTAKLGRPAGTEALRAQAADPDQTMALAQYELVRAAAGPALDKLLRNPEGVRFLALLLGNRDWLEMLLSSGLLPENDDGEALTGEAVAVLFRLWQDDPACARHRVLRRMSVAVALSFTQPHQRDRTNADTTPSSRYRFFRDSWAAGRLHPTFDKLEAWEMRYVVGTAWDEESLAWLQANVRMPVSKMGDACWIADYRGSTVFGDSIFRDGFYTPWDGAMSRAENIRKHGGVCGSLSYFGAMSCAARGIPAMPVGQPGHCAYAFRPLGQPWQGGFGGPVGGCHLSLYGDISDWREMTEDALRDPTLTLASRRHAWQGRRAEAEGQDAGPAWQLAIDACPLAYEAWRDANRWRLAHDPGGGWEAWTDKMAKAYAHHPYVFFDLLAPLESRLAKDDPARLALWSRYHKALADGWAHPDWFLKNILDAQADRLGEKSDRSLRVAEMILPATVKSAQAFPAAIDWTRNALAGTDEGKRRWLDLVVRTLGTGDFGGSTESKLATILNQGILIASAAGARDAFNALAEQVRALKKITPPDIPPFDPFPGENLAKGGLLRASSTSSWDNPGMHPCVLDRGGAFHTDQETHPWVEVQLIKLAELSGVVLVNNSNGARLPPIKITVSEDGKTWTQVARIATEQQVYRIDLSATKPRCRRLRIERDDDRREFFHFNLIHAYGRRLE